MQSEGAIYTRSGMLWRFSAVALLLLGGIGAGSAQAETALPVMRPANQTQPAQHRDGVPLPPTRQEKLAQTPPAGKAGAKTAPAPQEVVEPLKLATVAADASIPVPPQRVNAPEVPPTTTQTDPLDAPYDPSVVLPRTRAPAIKALAEHHKNTLLRAPSNALPPKVKTAALQHGLDLSQTSLIGIMDVSKGRQALLRLPDGEFLTVNQNDDVHGWRVNRIEDKSMELLRSDQRMTLKLIAQR